MRRHSVDDRGRRRSGCRRARRWPHRSEPPCGCRRPKAAGETFVSTWPRAASQLGDGEPRSPPASGTSRWPPAPWRRSLEGERDLGLMALILSSSAATPARSSAMVARRRTMPASSLARASTLRKSPWAASMAAWTPASFLASDASSSSMRVIFFVVARLSSATCSDLASMAVFLSRAATMMPRWGSSSSSLLRRLISRSMRCSSNRPSDIVARSLHGTPHFRSLFSP